MNKPYFTKYIVQSEELSWYLKDGEMIEREWYPPTGGFKREIVPYKTGMQSLSEKRVKLFLCSRDIQVGDKIRTDNSIKEILLDGEINTLEMLDDSWFKVIGEISPNAIWIKEGMEFDEDDWEACYIGVDDKHIISKMAYNHSIHPDQQKYYRYGCKLKCPTCHIFH